MDAGFQQDQRTLVSLSLRLKDLLGPVTRVKKKKKTSALAAKTVSEEATQPSPEIPESGPLRKVVHLGEWST